MNRFLKGLIVYCAGALFVVGLLIPIALANGEPKGPRRVKVEELFNSNCARCHGADGRGDTPSGHLFKAPDFTDADWWKKNSSLTTNQAFRSVITRGKGAMPEFGKKLTKSEIKLLSDRVRKFRPVR